MMNLLARIMCVSKLPVPLNVTIIRLKHNKQKCKKDDCDKRHFFLENFSCKNALVTGGTGGIGLQVAHQLLACKARKVALVSNDAYSGKSSIDDLNCIYGRDKAIFVNCDVESRKEICDCYATVKEEFETIDIVVNCAGLFNGCSWEKEINTNLVGVVRSTVAAYTYMSKLGSGNGGVILNIGGLYGLKPFAAAPTLSTAHHGVIGLSRSFGAKSNLEKSDVRVIALCPGFTNTNFLKGAEERTMNPNMGKELEFLLCKEKRQNPDAVAKAVVHVLQRGRSGSVWVVEGSRLYSIKIPKWKSYRKLESQIM